MVRHNALKIHLVATAITFVALHNGVASAYVDECETVEDETPGDALNGLVGRGGVLNYRINVAPELLNAVNRDSGAGAQGLTRDQWVHAVLQAAETWNSQSSTGILRYMGDVIDAGFPDLKPQYSCAAQQYSWVTLSSQCLSSTTRGSFHEKCDVGDVDGDGDIDRSRFEVCIAFDISNPTGGFQNKHWVVGDGADCIGGNCDDSIDLIGTLTHEFGHVLGLAHPLVCENVHPTYGYCTDTGFDSAVAAFASAVSPTQPSGQDGTTRHRDLYEYDVRCLHENHRVDDPPGVLPLRRHKLLEIPITNGTFGLFQASYPLVGT